MSSGNEVEEALNEMLPFLDVLTPENYKGQILDYILGMTGTTDGVGCLTKNKKLMDTMMDLICYDKSDKIRLDCLRIVVNLSSTSAAILKQLLVSDFVYFLLNAVVHKDLDCCDLVAMLLSNMTLALENCEQVATNLKNHDRVTLNMLVDAFCVQNYNKDCNLHHIGAFLSNMTQLKDIRLLFLKEEDKLIGRILPFTKCDIYPVKRLSAATVVKNCLFETDYHEWLLTDIDVLPYLLIPLAGPDTFTDEENDELPIDLQYLPADKKREPNKEIQLLLVESLFQLCATKKSRLIMKSSGAYYIMRELHKTIDEDDVISIALENLIQVLIGDEPDGDIENLRDIEIPEHIEKKLITLS